MWRRKKPNEPETVGFAEQPLSGERNHLTPKDVQEKVFRLSFRGYNEQDVDRFLDEVTEEIAALHEENKRLRESVEDRMSGSSSELLREAERRAGETVRQAREYAARLMEDAGKRAAQGGGNKGVAASSFLIRERDFLQRMASLIQEHAESLKAEARRSRAPTPAPMAATAPPPTVAEEPAPPEPPPQIVERPGPSETTEAHEPFLDDWEGTFSGGGEEQPFAGTASDLFPEERKAESGERTGERTKEREEPSLRELFWGEE
jgi:cell division initiation protein